MKRQPSFRGQSSGIVLAAVLSLASTIIVGGMLYYTLKRYETAQARQVAQVEQLAGEQQAVTAGRLFAHAGSAIIRTDPAKIQAVLSYGFPAKHLLGAVIVNQDDMIIAALDPSQVGQRSRDPQLAAQRTTKREMVVGPLTADGTRTMTILEPLMDSDGVVAWAWFRFGWPADGGYLRAPADRMVECARLLAPTFVLLFLSLVWAMRSATSGIRRQLQALVTSLVASPPVIEDPKDEVRKAG